VIVFKLDAVASQLYERLRNTLDYKTPIEQFNACVASTDGGGSR
jgi:IS30 family transposase